MEIVPIVNEQDEIIGYEERSKTRPDQLRRISALWLTNSKGEVLLAQRALTKQHHPGKWNFAVTGGVEKGETYESAMRREVVEELGIHNLEITPGPKFLSEVPEGRRFFCHYFLAMKDIELEEFRIDREEVAAIRWISPKDIIAEVKQHPKHFTFPAEQWEQWIEKQIPF